MSETASMRVHSVDALLMSTSWRPAALELLRGAVEGWTAGDLARWLTGPYREGSVPLPRPRVRAQGATIDPRAIVRILRAAREQVLEELHGARWSAGPLFMRSLVRQRAIAMAEDGLWVPIDKPRMLLKDRVLSLLAADYLFCPLEYTRRFALCIRCDAVVFDAAARQTGFCGAHRISGFLQVARPPAALTA
jgi:hypothetical protein